VLRPGPDRHGEDREWVKDRVVSAYWLIGYTVPTDIQAQALTEIEKELSKLPVAELPETELLTLAEGIRDRLYRPVIRAQDRARAEDERRRKQAHRRADLIAYGVSYANSELEKEEDLDAWARLIIRETVKWTLAKPVILGLVTDARPNDTRRDPFIQIADAVSDEPRGEPDKCGPETT
jgi:hypothetical protein